MNFMIKKQGITVTVMTITIILLVILAGTITISVYSTINYSTLSTWANELMYIQDIVNEQLNASYNTVFTLEEIVINILDTDIIQEQFEGEIISEENNVILKVIDLGKLDITNTKYGNLNNPKDVYAMSQETGRVYYVQGLEVEDKTYYTLTDSLKDRFGLNTSHGKLTSVVFVPSVIGYSNKPITVTVKIPNTYTNIVITTSNEEIQIGSQTVKENTYEYQVNTNNIAGNYAVTVSYNDGTKTLTSEYKVDGYDITPPQINPITYDDIVYKETNTKITDYLTNITATDESGIKVMKYMVGTVDEEKVKEEFASNTNIIADGKINLDRTTTVYTIYAEDNAGNFSILTFDKKDIMPESWKDNVSYIQDRVPIPKGFVASQAAGENTKNGGLVIYEGTTPVTDANVEDAKRTRNQYVWVPVDNFSNLKRQNFGSLDIISNKVSEEYWEVELDLSTGMPLATQNTDYVSETTLTEVQAMYASVKAYKGFYIARYEEGLDTQRTSNTSLVKGSNIYSVMGKIPYNCIAWGTNMADDTNGAVEVARSVYPVTNTNYGIVSTLTYGVQWDRILAWWLEVGAKDGKGNVVTSITNSISYGNYNEHVIVAGDLNDGAKYAEYSNSLLASYQSATASSAKASGTRWSLTTGALKVASINNIYDMAGNMWEWTMEGNTSNLRTIRGGGLYSDGSVYERNRSQSDQDAANTTYGLRIALYIKQ